MRTLSETLEAKELHFKALSAISKVHIVIRANFDAKGMVFDHSSSSYHLIAILERRKKQQQQNDIPCNTSELSFQSLNTTVTLATGQFYIIHVLIITLRKASHHTLRRFE